MGQRAYKHDEARVLVQFLTTAQALELISLGVCVTPVQSVKERAQRVTYSRRPGC